MPGGPVTTRIAPAWRGLLAVVWVVLAGWASLAPALTHGSKLGSYDVAALYGFGRGTAATPFNAVASDQAQQTIPWTDLDWTEVHDGHLPLWNPYAAMGTPLLANFQSAGFSLPVLVSYVAPRRLAYDVVVLMKLAIAGTGLLLLARTLRLGWVAAAFAGTVGELSGAFSGWLAWPMAGVLCWTGWVLAAALLLAEGRRTRAAVPLLAVASAFAVYGGHPESVVLLAVTVAVPVIVVLSLSGRPSLVRRLLALAGAGAGGLALSAPLLLAGAQALHGSVHQVRTGYTPFPLQVAGGLVFSGYWGYPTRSSTYFGVANYYETAAYVGLTALVLVVLGLARRGRRPGVAGLGLAALVLLLIAFSPTVAQVVDHVPGADLVVWNRALIPLDLLLGVLAGVGLDVLLSARGAAGRDRTAARSFAVAAVAGAAVLAAYAWHDAAHPPPTAVTAHIRAVSFRWPAAEAATLLLAAAACLLAARAGPRARPRPALAVTARVAVLSVVAVEVVFLVVGTPRLWGTSHRGLVVTPAIARLEAVVGEQRVGFDCPDATHFADEGILPEANAAYGLAEAEMYDAVLPLSYLRTYARLTGTPVAAPNSGNFCVPVTDAAVGREYGIAYVLKARGAAAPAGAVAVGRVDDEFLWRVPGASVVSLQPAGAPLDDPAATPVRFGERDPARLTLHVRAGAPSRLELHIGAYPGWSARIDGRRLALRPLYGQQMQALVPAGAHTVVVTYRPGPFVAGTWLAIAGLAGLAAFALAGLVSARRRSTDRSPAGAMRAEPADAAEVTAARPLSSLGTRAWRNRQTRQV